MFVIITHGFGAHIVTCTAYGIQRAALVKRQSGAVGLAQLFGFLHIALLGTDQTGIQCFGFQIVGVVLHLCMDFFAADGVYGHILIGIGAFGNVDLRFRRQTALCQQLFRGGECGHIGLGVDFTLAFRFGFDGGFGLAFGFLLGFRFAFLSGRGLAVEHVNFKHIAVGLLGFMADNLTVRIMHRRLDFHRLFAQRLQVNGIADLCAAFFQRIRQANAPHGALFAAFGQREVIAVLLLRIVAIRGGTVCNDAFTGA